MLVDTGWLAEHLDDPDLVVVDMRWRGDGSGRELYEAGHIPGARYFDWSSDLVDPDHDVAFMLAPPERLAAVLEAAGIGDLTTVVAYADELGSGPFRLWWACRTYGHENVHVLNGGFERWTSEGRPVSTEVPRPSPAEWSPRLDRRWVASGDDVAYARSRPDMVVLDSRPPEQFRGEAVWFEAGPVPADPDGVARTPRGEIRAGRVPGAVNLPAASLYRPDGTFRSPEDLRATFAALGAGPGRRAITYCGVGVSASALLFALTLAGLDEAALYDASWEEWGRDPTRPVERDAPGGRPDA